MATNLAIAIPTRNRRKQLTRLLESIAAQALVPPVLIVNDNTPGEPLAAAGCEVIAGPRRGAPWAHQAALDYLSAQDDPPEWILRLDDDLVLETPDFVERLWELTHWPDAYASITNIGAVGGVYPDAAHAERQVVERVGGTMASTTLEGMLSSHDSLQFHRWNLGVAVQVEHLYSSFMYRREAAVAVGGFARCYTRYGQREETDFSCRLHLAGWRLLVDTGAVAQHDSAPFGGRKGAASENARMIDEMVFVERLRSGALEREARGCGF